MDNKPAIQTSATVDPIDISYTENITHVYVKVDEPRGLSPRFEGPYRVMGRPSRSQVQVRIGSYADGTPRLVTYNWSWCKPAHLRENAPEGARPNIGRRPKPTASSSLLNVNNDAIGEKDRETSIPVGQNPPSEPAKFKCVSAPPPDSSQPLRPIRSTRNPRPVYSSAIYAA